MFDKLIEFLLGLITDILPCFVVTEYNKAVVFRAGKFHKVADGGIHWKIPFIDQPDERTVITTTMSIPTQSITTKDGIQLVVKAVVKYNINDIKKHVLNVYDPIDAISDTTQGIVKEQITSRFLKDCADNELDNEITKKVRVAVKHWGLEIEKVTLTDMGTIKSLRLFNETSNIFNG